MPLNLTVNQKRWAIVGGVFAALVVAGAIGARKKPLDVKTVGVTKGLVERTVSSTSSGTVMAKQAADLKSEITARIERHEAKEGDRVKAGQPVVTLDTASLKAALSLNQASHAAQKARIEQAKAKLTNAKQDYERTSNLFKENIVSEDKLQASQTAFEVAQGELSAAKAALEQTAAQIQMDQVNLSKATVRAPFDGVVTNLDLDPGETAVVGTRLARIVNNDDIYVEAPVDEADLGLLHNDQDVRVSFDAYPKESFNGKLTYISPIVSKDSNAVRTVNVRVTLPNTSARFRDGMSADLEIIVEKLDAVPYVPTQSVINTADESYVYVVREGKISKQVVKAGISNWDRTEIKTGLSDSDHVVHTVDKQEISEGRRVKEEFAGDSGHAAR